ncbi:hypothetical protein CTI12_AA329580 [Artemisia annua]|uniref:Uncharacterized protein n=1 Tax=Artemisia annua TaxID=35608 RepID=A0A2U1MQ81_ARTAN|nr:hypothetical protein CTI12_AA329580 [Artemisia annua]
MAFFVKESEHLEIKEEIRSATDNFNDNKVIGTRGKYQRFFKAFACGNVEMAEPVLNEDIFPKLQSSSLFWIANKIDLYSLANIFGFLYKFKIAS